METSEKMEENTGIPFKWKKYMEFTLLLHVAETRLASSLWVIYIVGEDVTNAL